MDHKPKLRADMLRSTLNSLWLPHQDAAGAEIGEDALARAIGGWEPSRCRVRYQHESFLFFLIDCNRGLVPGVGEGRKPRSLVPRSRQE